MEFNIDLKIENPRLNDNYKIHKKCDNKSRPAARKYTRQKNIIEDSKGSN